SAGAGRAPSARRDGPPPPRRARNRARRHRPSAATPAARPEARLPRPPALHDALPAGEIVRDRDVGVALECGGHLLGAPLVDLEDEPAVEDAARCLDKSER